MWEPACWRWAACGPLAIACRQAPTKFSSRHAVQKPVLMLCWNHFYAVQEPFFMWCMDHWFAMWEPACWRWAACGPLAIACRQAPTKFSSRHAVQKPVLMLCWNYFYAVQEPFFMWCMDHWFAMWEPACWRWAACGPLAIACRQAPTKLSFACRQASVKFGCVRSVMCALVRPRPIGTPSVPPPCPQPPGPAI